MMAILEIPGDVSDAIETASNDKADERYVILTGIEPNQLEWNRNNDRWRLFRQTEERRLRALWAIAHPTGGQE
jgi:hypothetical protein